MLLSAAVVLLFASPTQDPALDAKVTFTNAGAPIPALVEQLSATAKVRLFAPVAFQKDIVTLRVKEARLGAVMDKIADLTAGDWKRADDGYTLTRSGAKLRAEQQAEFEAQVAMFQKAIDRQKANLVKMEPWDEKTAKAVAIGLNEAQRSQGRSDGSMAFDSGAWRRIQSLDARGPGGRAMSRIVATLQARDLAALPFEYKIAFSDKPTRLQRELPASVVPALKDLASEQNLWADVANQVFPDNQGGAYYSSAVGMKQNFQGGVGKVLLLITKTYNFGMINANVELVVADEKGAVAMRANQSISSIPDQGGFQMPTPEAGEQPLPASPVGSALNDIMSGRRGATPKPIAMQIIDQLTHPEHDEPIALSIGDLLVRIAAAKNLQLISEMPDEAFLMGAYASMQKTTPSMLLNLLKYANFASDQHDGWLVISSPSRSSQRSDRVDRAVLGAYLRNVAKKGRASLDELASYAAAVPGDLNSSLGFSITRLLAPQQANQYYDVHMLRLYGLLDPAQRQLLANGNSLPLANLSGAAAENVNKMVFGQNPNLMPAQTRNPGDSSLFYNGIRREPTELFGQGVPPNSVLTMTDHSDSVVMTDPYEGSPGAVFGGQGMNPNDVAQALYARERPGIFPWMDNQPSPLDRKFSTGSRRTLMFTFAFGNLAWMAQSLQDATLDPAAPVPYDQLPQSFRDAVTKALADLRKAYANVKPGQLGTAPGGGSRPPPP